MEEKEIIWQERFQADIFSLDFYKQLRLEQIKLPPTEQSFYYNLDIQVPLMSLWQVDRIEEYFLHHSTRYSEGEDKFGYILSERARGIEDMFQALGYQLQDTCIWGEETKNPHEVIFTLWLGNPKEYFANGALKPIYCTTAVIPCRPDFLTLLQRILAKHYARMEEAVWDETID